MKNRTQRINKSIRKIIYKLQGVYQSLHKKPLLLISIAGILAITFLTLAVSWQHTPNSQKTIKNKTASVSLLHKQTIDQLNRIETQIKTLQQQQPNTEAMTNQEVSQLSAQLDRITQSLHNLSGQDDAQKTQAMILSTHQNIASRIDDLHSLLEKIKKQVAPRHYLSVSALPFKVQDVIVVNGVSKVLISDKQGDNYILRAKNERYGHWRIVQISYDPKQVLLSNPKKQYVNVNISK